MNNNNIIHFPKAVAVGRQVSHDSTGQVAARVIDLSTYESKHAANKGRRHGWNDALQMVDVWEALNEGRLVVHYQPQYDISSGKTVAAEALVRLIDRAGELIFPDRFIHLAEHSDLIVPLGRAVISQVCADLETSRAQGVAIQRVAINLAARQLELDHKLLDFIDRELGDCGLQYRDLEFELTERQKLAPGGTGIAQLNELAGRGARIVLDDFGIGYSSIIYLTELPISAFKLDYALTSRLAHDQSTRCVVEGLLAMATRLGLEVVAEGIETPAQHEFLERAGCPFGQGFGYARPMPIEALQAFLIDSRHANQNDRAARP